MSTENLVPYISDRVVGKMISVTSVEEIGDNFCFAVPKVDGIPMSKISAIASQLMIEEEFDCRVTSCMDFEMTAGNWSETMGWKAPTPFMLYAHVGGCSSYEEYFDNSQYLSTNLKWVRELGAQGISALPELKRENVDELVASCTHMGFFDGAIVVARSQAGIRRVYKVKPLLTTTAAVVEISGETAVCTSQRTLWSGGGTFHRIEQGTEIRVKTVPGVSSVGQMVEIGFTQFTDSGRLRHPRIIRVRSGK